MLHGTEAHAGSGTAPASPPGMHWPALHVLCHTHGGCSLFLKDRPWQSRVVVLRRVVAAQPLRCTACLWVEAQLTPRPLLPMRPRLLMQGLGDPTTCLHARLHPIPMCFNSKFSCQQPHSPLLCAPEGSAAPPQRSGSSWPRRPPASELPTFVTCSRAGFQLVDYRRGHREVY